MEYNLLEMAFNLLCNVDQGVGDPPDFAGNQTEEWREAWSTWKTRYHEQIASEHHA